MSHFCNMSSAIPDGKSTPSILNFFSRKSDRPRPANLDKRVPCPACSVLVEKTAINSHLDNDCGSKSNVSGSNENSDEAAVTEEKRVTADNGNEIDDGGAFSSSDEAEFADAAFSLVEAVYSASSQSSVEADHRDRDRELPSTPKRYDFESCAPRRFDDSPFTSPPPSSPKTTIRASPSVSANPKRFGLGAREIEDNAIVMSPTSSGRKSSRFRRFSPRKPHPRNEERDARKALFPQLPPEGSSPAKGEGGESRFGFHLRNFEHVVTCVLDCTDDRRLFNDGELAFVDRFRTSLCLDARRLYVRLFERKFDWIRREKINYGGKEVGDEDGALRELEETGFLRTGEGVVDLENVLTLLPAAAVTEVHKAMNLPRKKAGSNNKAECIKSLLRHAKTKNPFAVAAKKGGGGVEQAILKKARCYLTPAFKLEEEPRAIFLRVIALFSLESFWEIRENDRGPRTLVTLNRIFLENGGRLTFPTYDIVREAKIFRHREDLLAFEDAGAVENAIAEILERKEYVEGGDACDAACEAARAKFALALDDAALTEHVRLLPRFLRKFTVGSVLAYALTKCVDVLEKRRKYEEATALLRTLLAQDLYLPDYHGLWHERLALDLHQHLKRPLLSLRSIRAGLDDPHVREARKLALCQRAEKICAAKKNVAAKKEFRAELEGMRGSPNWADPGIDTPKVVIRGQMFDKDGVPGAKTVFYSAANNICGSVEEFAVEHFRSASDMPEGLHAEGAVFNTLCAVLFWEVFYDVVVPDAFRNPFQKRPLDHHTDDFYANRSEAIDARLEQIEGADDAELGEMIRERWEKSLGVTSMVNWELFRGWEHLSGLALCFTRAQLRGVLERLVKGHRHTRSGFPDLTLWNPDRKAVKIVEVKSPNDRLSNKQILWIDHLRRLGVDAVVCHVEAFGGKRIAAADDDTAAVNDESDAAAAEETVENGKRRRQKRRRRRDSGDDFL